MALCPIDHHLLSGNGYEIQQSMATDSGQLQETMVNDITTYCFNQIQDHHMYNKTICSCQKADNGCSFLVICTLTTI